MSDQSASAPVPEPLSDETIEAFIDLLTTICQLAQTMQMSVPETARFMLKTMQVIGKLQHGNAGDAAGKLAAMLTGRVQ